MPQTAIMLLFGSPHDPFSSLWEVMHSISLLLSGLATNFFYFFYLFFDSSTSFFSLFLRANPNLGVILISLLLNREVFDVYC